MTGQRPTRRRVLRYGAALGVGGVALTTSAAANPGKGDEKGNGKSFGRVYASDEQASPFVSESAPGDRDWNGGQWTHFDAEVTDIDAFNEDAPLTNADAVLDKGYIEVTLGRPGFGPPDFFVCPLNGRT